MTNTFKLTDKNNETRNFKIINRDFYNDMLNNSITPDEAAIWMALGEVAGHIQKI